MMELERREFLKRGTVGEAERYATDGGLVWIRGIQLSEGRGGLERKRFCKERGGGR